MAISAKERINALRELLGQPRDDDWYYVWVKPTKQANVFSIDPMIEWCRENRTIYWEYTWIHKKAYKKWKWSQAVATLYPDREVCFRFSNPEDAVLFKITWS